MEWRRGATAAICEGFPSDRQRRWLDLTPKPGSQIRCSCYGQTDCPRARPGTLKSSLMGIGRLLSSPGAEFRTRVANDKDFGGKSPAVVKALSAIPDETLIGAEVGALAR